MKKAFFETGPSKLGLEIVVAVDSKLLKGDAFMRAARLLS